MRAALKDQPEHPPSFEGVPIRRLYALLINTTLQLLWTFWLHHRSHQGKRKEDVPSHPRALTNKYSNTLMVRIRLTEQNGLGRLNPSFAVLITSIPAFI